MTRNLGPWIGLAGVFVGAGLYFGLRARPAVQTRLAHADASVQRSQDVVERDIRTAFEVVRGKWRIACWDPIVAKAPAPATSVHSISTAVNDEGNEILRSINDLRDQTRFDVAACLREQPYEPIHIARPGRSTSTVITIQFP